MKTMFITAKCSDMFRVSLRDDSMGEVREYEGYVPKWFPNQDVLHCGDYVELEIDVSTGRILNWKKPTEEDLSETFLK
jgi:hypothetical protein